jgi:quercetin dioxygenase-like cupin family protein
MPLGHINALTPKPVTNPAALDAAMRVLVGPELGWDDHVMRVFDLQPGGYTPKHHHDWPHINYILSGEGTLFLDDQENPIAAGAYAYVPANALHQFRNTSDKPLQFICIVPTKGHY